MGRLDDLISLDRNRLHATDGIEVAV